MELGKIPSEMEKAELPNAHNSAVKPSLPQKTCRFPSPPHEGVSSIGIIFYLFGRPLITYTSD
jgi:hypothetical protein